MKKNRWFGLALVATIMGASFSACSNEAEEVLAQESEIKLTSEITPSRVTSLNYQSTQIVEGQQIGVTITGAKSEHNNVAWTAGVNGTLTNTGATLYWGKSDVEIKAYHPYNPEWTGTNHTFSINTDQSTDVGYLNSDLLWTTTTAPKTGNPITLNFLHKLAKINVTLTSEDIEDLSNAIISICGTNITTDFNPNNGELSNSSNIQDIIAGVTTSSTYTASAIIIPQTIANGAELIKVCHNNKNYTYTLSENKLFESGHSYSYTLKLKEKQIEVDVESDNITNWDDESIEGEMKEEIETLLLPYGPTFNEIIGKTLANNTNLIKISFIANSETKSETELITDADGTIGYIIENGEYLEIHTSAEEFIANESCNTMFGAGDDDNPKRFRNIVNINFGKHFNTSNVTDMTGMFWGCEKLTHLDLNKFDTSKVTSMHWMFLGCSELKSLDLNNFNTSNVTIMSAMFWGCEKLTHLDLNKFDTSKVTSMEGMFLGCSELKSLDLNNFNTSNVTNMSEMFLACRNLESLNIRNFNTSSVVNMNQMFWGCANLKSLDLTCFSFKGNPTVTDMLFEVGYFTTEKALIPVNQEGYDYLSNSDCGINDQYAAFVKPE